MKFAILLAVFEQTISSVFLCDEGYFSTRVSDDLHGCRNDEVFCMQSLRCVPLDDQTEKPVDHHNTVDYYKPIHCKSNECVPFDQDSQDRTRDLEETEVPASCAFGEIFCLASMSCVPDSEHKLIPDTETQNTKKPFPNVESKPSSKPNRNAAGAAAKPSSKPIPNAAGAAIKPSSKPIPNAAGAAAKYSSKPIPNAAGAAIKPSSKPIPNAAGAAAKYSSKPIPNAAGGDTKPTSKPATPTHGVVTKSKTIEPVSLQVSLEPKERTTCTYHGYAKTGDGWFTGTDGDISFQVIGDHGSTGLAYGGSGHYSFESGETDSFSITSLDIGEVTSLKISNGGGGWFSGWHLESVKVRVDPKGYVYTFSVNRWITAGRSITVYPYNVYKPNPPAQPALVSTKSSSLKTTSGGIIGKELSNANNMHSSTVKTTAKSKSNGSLLLKTTSNFPKFIEKSKISSLKWKGGVGAAKTTPTSVHDVTYKSTKNPINVFSSKSTTWTDHQSLNPATTQPTGKLSSPTPKPTSKAKPNPTVEKESEISAEIKVVDPERRQPFVKKSSSGIANLFAKMIAEMKGWASNTGKCMGRGVNNLSPSFSKIYL